MTYIVKGRLVLIAVAFGLAWAGYGYGGTPSTPPTTAPPPPPKPTWVVVEVMNVKGVVTYESISPQSLKTRLEQLRREYLTALETWKKNKALADINKTTFVEEKPVRGYVRRAETTPPSFRYPELAQAKAAMLAKRRLEQAPGEKAGKPATAPEADKTAGPSKPHTAPTGEAVNPSTTDTPDTATAEGTAIAQKTCPVTGDPINKDIVVDYQGRRIFLCCPECKPTFSKDLEKYVRVVDEEIQCAAPEKAGTK